MEENNNSQFDVDAIEITEDMAKKMGLNHDFVGQPLSAGLDQFKKAKGLATRTAQEKAELEKELKALKEAKQSQPVSRQANDDDLPPDPMTYENTVEGSLKYRNDYAKWARTQMKNEFEQQYGSKIQTLEKAHSSQQEERIINTIAEQLPEGVDVQEAIVDWAKDSGVTADQLPGFMNAPNLIIKGVVNHAHIKNMSKSQDETDRLQGLNLTNQAKNVVQHKKPSSINSNTRTQKKESIASRIADTLEARQPQRKEG